MPVITFKYQDLKDLGIDMEKDELIDTLPMMASDIEDYDDEEIKVEFFPNRPDNLSVEGVARSFKGFLGMETGLPKYEIEPSREKVYVSPEVAEIRPFIRSNTSWISRKTCIGLLEETVKKWQLVSITQMLSVDHTNTLQLLKTKIHLFLLKWMRK